ncbi:MAG: LysR family transcriptional regulator [Alphaproteobacteria bacterium]|nr:LysR family transcriptional regulator [Alphaproteobacteria bacterium]
MSLIELKTFLAVIEARGVSSAAISLNMTQPAITKRLKNLRNSFEIETLFTRKSGEFHISEEAKLLIPFAQNLIALAENAKKEIKNYTNGVKGKISIGAGTTWSLGNLPKGLAKTAEKFPELEIDLNIEAPDLLLNKLSKNKMDIIFARKPENLCNFDFIHLRTDQFLIFASSSHPIFEKDISLKDLSKYKWTMNTAAKQTEDIFFNWFHSRNIEKPVISLKTNSLRLALKVVENSKMLLFTTSPIYSAPDSFNLTQIKINDFNLKRDTGIITRKGYKSYFLVELLKNIKTQGL